jgi:hypothetical protein
MTNMTNMTNISRFITELFNDKDQYDSVSGEDQKRFYLELGVGDWDSGNNTLFLEESGWDGISMDIGSRFVDNFNKNRTNKCIQADALKTNFYDFFKEHNIPKRIDYLQIDLHGDHQPGQKASNDITKPLKCLTSLPLQDYRFSVITFDFGNLNAFNNLAIRDAQRQILSSYGYNLLVDLFYEDWWVDGEYIPYEVYNRFHQYNK